MIPFAILAGRLISEFHSLEIRILDLSLESFTFRLSRSAVPELERVREITLDFYEFQRQGYRRVNINEFHIQEEEHADFWVLFRVFVRGEAREFYERAVAKVSREYINYVEDKLTLDDAELSEAMIGYPASKDQYYAENVKDQKKIWMDEVREGFCRESWRDCHGISLGVLLDHPSILNCFLSSPWTLFVKNLWKSWDLDWHPMADQLPDHIYLGNSFCPLLMPSWQKLLQATSLAFENSLGVTILFPPASESSIYEYENMLKELHRWAIGENHTLYVEVNDHGLWQYCLQESEQFTHFICVRGILLHKKRKDPRMTYRIVKEEAGSMLDMTEQEVYLPYYQTNTATFCTMHSYCRHGDRGYQYRVQECRMYCSDHHLLYPSHLHLLGRYNSLFGFDRESLMDGSILKKLTFQGRRIVSNKL